MIIENLTIQGVKILKKEKVINPILDAELLLTVINRYEMQN